MKLDVIIGSVLDFLENYKFTKWELFALIIVILLFASLPAILKHRRGMTKIRNDFRLESMKETAKIDLEREKRARKALKGNKK